MNYCNPNRNNGGVLSPLDVLGTQRVYGPKPGGSLVTYDGRCVDVRYGSDADFTAVQAYDCQAADRSGRFPAANANQRWYYLAPFHELAWGGSKAGRVLDVRYGGTANGTPVDRTITDSAGLCLVTPNCRR